jgi:hypothetical protein
MSKGSPAAVMDSTSGRYYGEGWIIPEGSRPKAGPLRVPDLGYADFREFLTGEVRGIPLPGI